MHLKRICSFDGTVLILSSLLYIVTVVAGQQMSIHDRMYVNIDRGAACFRVMNGTHTFGCSSSLKGNVGVIQLIESLADLSWLVNGTGRGPYVAVIRPNMTQKSIITQLIGNEKMAGVLLMSGPEDGPHSANDSFSHADTCPNRYSSLSKSCNPDAPWNEGGTALMLQDWGFPMFFIEDEAMIKDIVECYKTFNLPLDETQNYRSLCALELSSHMFAAVNSRVCMRRNELMSISSSFSPMKYCDPIGGKNIYMPILPLKNGNVTAKESVIVVAARLDATSLFYGSAPGSLSAVTSIVTTLYTAYLLNQLLHNSTATPKENVVFLLLNGETYDYIGSTRVVYDMKQKMFPNPTKFFTTNHIKLFIELSQLRSPNQLYYHFRNSTVNTIDPFILSLKEKSSSFGINPVPVDGTTYLPPASFQTFLKDNPDIPGFILTNDQKQFKNRFYESIFDDAKNLNYIYAHNTTGIPPGSVQSFLANLSTSLAYTLFESITGSKISANTSPKVSYSQVDKLLHCYLENQNCSLWRSFAGDVKLDARPLPLYVGVDRHTNVATTFTTLTLASFTGENTTLSSSQCTLENAVSEDYSYIWMYGDATNGVCVKSLVNVSPATSPAFDIPDYKWDSGEFPTWTESVWSEFSLRMFLKPSRSHEIFAMSVGVTVITLSLFVVRRLNHCAGTVFSSTPSSPGS